jgi:hypothetical protein
MRKLSILLQQQIGMGSVYKKRWFVLEKSTLTYFTDDRPVARPASLSFPTLRLR